MLNQLQTREITVPLAKIKTGRYQQRHTFNVEEMRGLAQTIREDGLISPPLVVAVNGHYELIAGDRRRRALCALALVADGQNIDQALTLVCTRQIDSLPDRFDILHQATARVNLSSETDPITLRALATIENLQRVDLSPLEKAHGYQSLLDAGLTPAQVVEKTGVTWTQVKNHLALLALPEVVQERFDRKALPMSALKDLAQLPADQQVEVAEKMTGRKARDIRTVVKMVKRNRPANGPGETQDFASPPSLSPQEEKPASLREQLAEARNLIARLVGQLHLDGRLLGQCAGALTECDPDSRLARMALARSEQIDRAIRQRAHPPTAAQRDRGRKIETFIQKRQGGHRVAGR